MSWKQDRLCLSNLVHLGSVTVKVLHVQQCRLCYHQYSSRHILVRPKIQREIKKCYQKQPALSKGEHEAEIHSLIGCGCELQTLSIITVPDGQNICKILRTPSLGFYLPCESCLLPAVYLVLLLCLCFASNKCWSFFPRKMCIVESIISDCSRKGVKMHIF